MTFNSGPIELSLEIAADRVDDIAPQVYQKLFARYPELEALFVRDTTGAVKGEMLARTIEALLDFIGPRAYARHMVQTEAVTHEGYGVPREVFPAFFTAIADSIRDVLGDDWTEDMKLSWQAMLAEIAFFAAHTDQKIEAATAAP